MIPGAAKLRRWARCARQRIAPGSLVLLYHRIAERSFDPWSLCVSPRHFAEHLEALRGRVRPLADLGRARRGAVAITFDDGYSDAWHAAHPLLERNDAAATVFVATGGVDDGRPFWWDQLAELLRPGRPLPRALDLRVHGEWRRFELAQGAAGGEPTAGAGLDAWPASRRRLLEQVHLLLGSLEAAERGEQLATLREWAGSAPAGVDDRALGREEIRSLARGGLVEIGAHSVSHPRLTALGPEDREREIGGSQAFLSDLLGGPVTSFSYPHGRHDAATRESLRARGFERACTSEAGLARHGGDPLQLPRIEVPDCDGDAFARLLRRLGF